MSVVSSPVLASCDTKTCPDELCSSESEKESEPVKQHGVCLSVPKSLCSQPRVNLS